MKTIIGFLSSIISWTGWTKEDYAELALSPLSWTGWTKEEWKECAVDYIQGLGLGILLVGALYLLFCSGLAV